MRILGIVLLLTGSLISKSYSQGEDQLGAWYMYFGTNKISEKFSIHSEVQFRFHKITKDRNQFLLRTGLNWHLSDQVIILLGYGYFLTWDPLDSEQLLNREHRIFEQFILRSPVGRLYLDSRFRIEQRWVGDDGNYVNYNFKSRARYRIYAEYPLNKAKKEPGTFLAVAYDEIFLNIDKNNVFDQNRLYLAFGYQFSTPLNIQVGYLLQTISGNNLNLLQFTIYLNPDLRKR